jgi:hypothetical protein
MCVLLSLSGGLSARTILCGGRPPQTAGEALASLSWNPSQLEGMEERPGRKLPKGPGEKRLRLLGTPEETERLQRYLREQMAAQSGPRPARKSLSTATWDPASRLAALTGQKGSHWSTHGHTHSGRLVLEPHEALFLLEMGCLEVEAGGLPLTLQQVALLVDLCSTHSPRSKQTLSIPVSFTCRHTGQSLETIFHCSCTP